MIPKDIQDAAERAYNLFREHYPNEPAWVDYEPKHQWYDRVTAYQAARATGYPPANLAEECVATAVDGPVVTSPAETPVEAPAPVKPVAEAKPKASKKEK